MIWSVPRTREGQTAYVLAGGPSLRGFDAAPLHEEQKACRGFVVTINDSWRLAPWASVHYFCDWCWWQEQLALNREALVGAGLRPRFRDEAHRGFWVAGNARFAEHPQVRVLRLGGQRGLSRDPGALCHGSNSGYQAVNLAYLYGAKKIVLLGYDMRTRTVGDALGHPVAERTHWHDEARPDGFAQILERTMLPCFDSIAAALALDGVEVVNATPGSALKCWPFRPLADVLAEEPGR